MQQSYGCFTTCAVKQCLVTYSAALAITILISILREAGVNFFSLVFYSISLNHFDWITELGNIVTFFFQVE